MTAVSGRTPAPVVDVAITSPLWEKQPLAEQTVRAALAAVTAALATPPGEVCILLTDDTNIARLNRDWRGVDKPTNVLSFLAAQPAGTPFLGDVAVAYETLQRECEAEGRVFLHHLAHLTVHGFLHLIGYDHQTDSDAEAMEGVESRIMLALNMPDPWLTRDA